MDARKERLEAAKAAGQEAEQAIEAVRAQAEEKIAARQEEETAKLEAKLREAAMTGKKRLEEAKQTRMSTVSAYREVMEAEFVSDSERAKSELETLADGFLRTVYPENASGSEAGSQ